MALDTRYYLAFTFGQYFVDKDTGEPLANGVVTFYRDAARNEAKSVYVLTGNPPDYTYTDIGNEVELNSVGEPTYNGNNVALYFFPYDGTPDDTDNTVDLYYYTVYSSDDVLQFTRSGQPNIGESSSEEEVTENFIPNGQFLTHNNLPETSDYDAGEIREDDTPIAYGGWSFDRSTGATSTDFVLFDRFGSFTTNPDGNPRYAVNVLCQTAGTSTYKDLSVKFMDVNKFNSVDTSDLYTFSFNGVDNLGNGLEVDLYLIKNYGTGGSSKDSQKLTTFTLTNGYEIYSYSFSFGSNVNKTIGAGDDDYLQLALRFPLDDEFDASFTDFILAKGQLVEPEFPPTTDEQMRYRSITVPVPEYDGSDLYLPLVLTRSGLAFDTTIIGKVFPVVYDAPEIGELPCDGLEKYEYLGYSDDFIPYQRLGDKLWNDTVGVFNFGTGPDYFTGVYFGSGNEFLIANNSAGSPGVAADGAAATGFTFATVHTGFGYYAKCFINGDNTDELYLECVNGGRVDIPSDNGTGFTVDYGETFPHDPYIQRGTSVGGYSPITIPQRIKITTVAASAPLAGTYIDFQTVDNSNIGADFFVWFKVDGAGAQPAGSGTPIAVNVNSTDTAAIVAEKMREALNGWEVSSIKTVAASALSGGDYLTVNATGADYYVWYEIDGSGADPAPGSRIGIKVEITASDTAAQVAQKTQKAINKKYYTTPDFRGNFIRGWSDASDVDTEKTLRYSMVPGIGGNLISTMQMDNNLQHFHPTISPGAPPVQFFYNRTSEDIGTGRDIADDAGQANVNPTASYQGATEAKPKNIYMNYVIKY
jgi:hypothetical protein